jgi:hypothetical protein
VGYALARFKRMSAVVDWMADWRSRPDVEPWMLFNLGYALRHQGRYSEANEVAEHAVQKWGYRRQNGADLRLFLAVEQALEGSVDEAKESLQGVYVRSQVVYDQQILAIAKALVEFQDSASERRRQQFKVIRRKLEAVFPIRDTLTSGRDVRGTLRRAGRVFVQNGAGPWARIWFFWRLNWQWSLLPLAPFLLVGVLFPPVLLGLIFWLMVRRIRRKT